MNETIQGITFEQLYPITSQIPVIFVIIIAFALPLLIYILWGVFSHARTSEGRKIGKLTIYTRNFWIGWLIILFFNTLGALSLIFPIWLRLFEPA